MRRITQHVWHAAFTCMIRLIHLCDITHSFLWHYSFTRAPWRYTNRGRGVMRVRTLVHWKLTGGNKGMCCNETLFYLHIGRQYVRHLTRGGTQESGGAKKTCQTLVMACLEAYLVLNVERPSCLACWEAPCWEAQLFWGQKWGPRWAPEAERERILHNYVYCTTMYLAQLCILHSYVLQCPVHSFDVLTLGHKHAQAHTFTARWGLEISRWLPICMLTYTHTCISTEVFQSIGTSW